MQEERGHPLLSKLYLGLPSVCVVVTQICLPISLSISAAFETEPALHAVHCEIEENTRYSSGTEMEPKEVFSCHITS